MENILINIQNKLLSQHQWIIIMTILLAIMVLILIVIELILVYQKRKTIQTSLNSKLNITMMILFIFGGCFTFLYFQPHHLEFESLELTLIYDQSGSVSINLNSDDSEQVTHFLEAIEFRRIYSGVDTYPSDVETYNLYLRERSSTRDSYTITFTPDEVAVHAGGAKTKSIAVHHDDYYDELLELIDSLN